MTLALPERFRNWKIGVALTPQKATEEQVDEFIQDLKARIPNAVILISVLPINGKIPNIDKPFLDNIVVSREKCGLVERCYSLLTFAKTKGLDYLFYDIRLKTYPISELIAFIQETLVSHQTADMVIAEPQLGEKRIAGFFEPSPAFTKAITSEKIRQRLLTDTFINFVLSSALCGHNQKMEYHNVTAGVFGVNTRQLDIVHRLITIDIERYRDSTLICPLIRWFLNGQEAEVRHIDVENAHIGELGFDLAKAVNEVDAVFTMIEREGNALSLTDMVNKYFADCQQVRFWKMEDDEKWFREIFVGALRKKGRTN